MVDEEWPPAWERSCGESIAENALSLDGRAELVWLVSYCCCSYDMR